MLNAIFYSFKEDYYTYSELNNTVFYKMGINLVMANSPKFLFNSINIDTKCVIFDFEEQDNWLEFSVSKRIGKNCKFLYFDRNKNIFLDYNGDRTLQITDIKNLFNNQLIYLKENAQAYTVKVRDVLDKMNLISYKFNSILLTKILVKMLMRNITTPKELDMSLICEDLGYDHKLITKRLGDYIKNWFKNNENFICRSFPIFRALESKNIKTFLSMFIYCLYEQLYKIEETKNTSFNLTYQVSMFDD